jgi:hypothetical protein
VSDDRLHGLGRRLFSGSEPVRRRQQSGHSQSTDVERSDRVAITIRHPISASVPAVRTFGAGEAQLTQASWLIVFFQGGVRATLRVASPVLGQIGCMDRPAAIDPQLKRGCFWKTTGPP